ncbi:MAG: AAA family ATPase [Minicystis sp.]
MDDSLLPTVRAALLADLSSHRRWLVESLWARAGVGIVGGAPKCCKSWLALDLALSVASNTPCLGHFAVHDPGPVLVYLAEDGPEAVKQRLLGLCRHRGLDLGAVPLDVITAPSLRLDLERDCARLGRTLRATAPRLLVLDPFVRLHRIDENSAAEVSLLLAFLRDLQREHDVAILVVHHARKNGPAGTQAGQGLRGSGDFHAWIDSALYVRRAKDHLNVSVEHRAAPAPEAFPMALVPDDAGAARLELLETHDDDSNGPDLRTRLLDALDRSGGVASREALRATLRLRNERLGIVLQDLLREGVLARDNEGWRRVPVPHKGKKAERNAASSP